MGDPLPSSQTPFPITQEICSILIVPKNCLLLNSSGNDVMKRSWRIDAWPSGHEEFLSEKSDAVKLYSYVRPLSHEWPEDMFEYLLIFSPLFGIINKSTLHQWPDLCNLARPQLRAFCFLSLNLKGICKFTQKERPLLKEVPQEDFTARGKLLP